MHLSFASVVYLSFICHIYLSCSCVIFICHVYLSFITVIFICHPSDLSVIYLSCVSVMSTGHFDSVVCICHLLLSFICHLYLLSVVYLCRVEEGGGGRKEEADFRLNSNNPTLKGGENITKTQNRPSQTTVGSPRLSSSPHILAPHPCRHGPTSLPPRHHIFGRVEVRGVIKYKGPP